MESPDNRPSEITTSHPEFRFSDVLPRMTSSFENLSAGIDLRFTYDGRAALFHLFRGIRTFGRPSVLLPAFHCPTVVEPALQSGLSVRFYRIKEDLSIDTDDFLRCLDESVCAAVVINYFGFPAEIDELRTACRTNRTWLIEDCAHSFLVSNPIQLAGGRADFGIFSFKKLVPSSVGGAIRCNVEGPDVVTDLVSPPIYKSMKILKRMIDQAIIQSNSRLLAGVQKGADALYGRLKRQTSGTRTVAAETTNDVGGDYSFDMRLVESRMPRIAKHVLNVAQLDEVVASRRSNYEFLRVQLLPVSKVRLAIHEFGSTACPWAMPVKIENRSTIDRELRSRGIPLFTFGETLHPALFQSQVTSDRAVESAEYLSTHLLCLSIHQGISMRYLKFVAGEVSRVLKAE